MNNDFDSNKNIDFEPNNEKIINKSKFVDIRIVLTDLDYIGAISKAISNFDLSNFNVNISSLIPTQNLEIAKNTIVGADLVLIASSSNPEGKSLFAKLKRELKNDYNFVEYLKLPSLEELNDYDYDYGEENTFEDEIANSIIRAGLYSISNLSVINDSKRKYYGIRSDFDRNRLKFDKINKENELLLKESKSMLEQNEKLMEEVKILQKDLDSIKSDYSDLKSRFESIHSKNSLEVFSLNELWQDLFNESLSEDIYRFILISTDNFRPKNLMIGQGAICAESKEDALDWLKIIKTAFILSDTNKKELDFNNFNSNFKFDDVDASDSVSSGSFASGRVRDFDSVSSGSFASGRVRDFDVSTDDSQSVRNGDFDSFSFNRREESLDDSDDFIYNERFEGNSDSEFRELNFQDDFSLNNDSIQNLDLDDDLNNFGQNNIANDSDEINVFNLKSLKSINDDEDESEEDYDYEEDVEDDDEVFDALSNLWN